MGDILNNQFYPIPSPLENRSEISIDDVFKAFIDGANYNVEQLQVFVVARNKKIKEEQEQEDSLSTGGVLFTSEEQEEEEEENPLPDDAEVFKGGWLVGWLVNLVGINPPPPPFQCTRC